MPTTSNFGWTTPADTDLVKNGALAIRTLGNGIDTTMAELKGGTTGQVLSKTSNTDMDFTWVTTDDANAIQNAIVDAKGDLIAATANDTPARLAVGNNGETLVADSSTSTGLRYNPTGAAGKNWIINGNFDIWQRGTSFASTNGYFADRWTNGAEQNAVTASRQTSGAPNGSQYYLRLTSTGASSYWTSTQYIETANVSQLWGRTVTISARLRRNSTANNTGLGIYLEKSSTTDAGSGASWSAITNASVQVANSLIPTGSTSSDWYLASFTTTIPNDGTANSLRLYINYNGATANGTIFEISQVQMEVGSVPTQFTRAGGTLAGELAACQRYYYVLADGSGQTFGTAAYYSATDVLGTVFFPVTMRTAPTFTAASGSFYEVVRNAAADGLTGLQSNYISTRTANIFAENTNGASGTAGHGGQYRTTSASANIAFSAEL